MARYKGSTHAADQMLVHLYQTWELLAGTSYKLHWGNERCVANHSCTPHLSCSTSPIGPPPSSIWHPSPSQTSPHPPAKITTFAVKPRSPCPLHVWSGLNCMCRSDARKYYSLPTLGHPEAGLSSASSCAASRAAYSTVSRSRRVRMTALCGSNVRLMFTSSFLDSVQ